MNCEIIHSSTASRPWIQVESDNEIPLSKFAELGDRLLYRRSGEDGGRKFIVGLATDLAEIEKLEERHDSINEEVQLIIYVNGIDHSSLGSPGAGVFGIIWINSMKDPILVPKSTFRAIKELNNKIDTMEASDGSHDGSQN